jgi:propionyl-CoA carboxylase beta chain
MGAKGAVEIIFREDKNDPSSWPQREAEYKERLPTPSWPAPVASSTT